MLTTKSHNRTTEGCQCGGYCGYDNEHPCNSDNQCIWKRGACYNKRTDQIGTNLGSCGITIAPTTNKPSTAPTTSTPTLVPTTQTPTTAPTTVYNLPGVLLNKAKSTLLTPEWTTCYDATYNDETTMIDSIITQCNGSIIMMGCYDSTIPSVITLAAVSPRDVVFAETGDSNTDYIDNNDVRWYKSVSSSWGFAPAGATLDRNLCDFLPPGYADSRLCWHMNGGSIFDGYRCGSNIPNGDTKWRRFLAYK
jgi:hypothetical protein